MDFDFTEDQVALREAVQRWADKSFPFERRLRIAHEGGYTRDVYGELAGLGLTGLVVDEASGGMGMGAVDAMVVMEELGRGLVNAPYLQAALVAPSIVASATDEIRASWLPKIADGSAIVVLAQQERHARYRLDAVATTTAARRDGNGWLIDGRKGIVPAGDEADAFIVPAVAEGKLSLFLCDKAAAAVEACPTQDGGRVAELRFDGSPAEMLVENGLPVLQRAVDIGTAAVCAEAVGLMEKLLALTADYMNTRQQFGVPIASFQALRHRIADVKMQLELGRSMSYYATLKLSEPDAALRHRAMSQAKLQLGRSMRFVAQQCLQLHGGIGMTDEYVGSHYFKRLTMLEMMFGDSMHHLGALSDAMR